ncbi:hypothetical protein HII36_08455 [Nonomuraea sp. NN258]|uniref:Kelch repeat-containing protein n=1 Tax=Nonomuraea antri TaxID=2730852 RepID=UPI001568E210|nr:hypothetical protein [Nonomuraea antri]NRQ31870.1 hypothetical protein [Nonomuraea antri]
MSRRGWIVTSVLVVLAGLVTVQVFTRSDDFLPRQVSPLPAAGPAPRGHHTAVWTGTELIVWGGDDGRRTLSDGARYHPVRKTWTRLPPPPIRPRSHHVAAWTGKEMIVWGGTSTPAETGFAALADGARYDPATGTWRRISPAPAPPLEAGVRAVGVPGYLVVAQRKAILVYEVATDRWRTVTPSDEGVDPLLEEVIDLAVAGDRVVVISRAHYLGTPPGLGFAVLDPAASTLEEVGASLGYGGLVGVGATFDGTHLRVLVEDEDGSTLHRVGLEDGETWDTPGAEPDYDDSDDGDWENPNAWQADGMPAPIRPGMPPTSGDSLVWTSGGPLALTSAGLSRFLVDTEAVETNGDVTGHCGGAAAAWTGISLMVWGCGGADGDGPPGQAVGLQITP